MDGSGLTSQAAAQAAEVCLCLHVRRAARSITQVFDLHLGPTGLKASQINLLMAVNSRKSTSIGDLAAALSTDSTTVSRTLKPLLREELVSERRDKSDRRIKQIELSAEGLAMLERAIPMWQAAQSAVARQLGSSAVQAFLPILEAAARMGPGDT
jgi:DNA-binding MarR family transcriptional regulator